MLEVENISNGYGKKQVLFDVSFSVKNGDILLIAGSNGSGKSTLLKAIYGIIPQWSKGSIIFDGEKITGKPTVALLKRGLLYIPQRNNLFEDLTVKENLQMAGLTLDTRLLQLRIENSLSIFATLVPHLNRIPMKLSGGERQLLILAMALLHQPKMIMVDEPFIGLSPQNITFVAKSLKALNEKSRITLLIVEHRVKECSLIANKVIGLKLGRVFCELNIDANFNILELNPIFI
jgi:branched-chain amino acid transport system ATP-binding protein